MPRAAGRPLRADAQRNRDKILSAAVRVFAEDGLDAHLERIAKEVGVGSGTLYRNFPTREVLIEAAYRNELSKLRDVAPQLLESMPPEGRCASGWAASSITRPPNSAWPTRCALWWNPAPILTPAARR
ncbi:TetR/AcrR family transcriptional regulator [Nocardia tengchongensis]|uniref:TetR/AcrR family transcriptional regulator n=1 Tax=Nocardia tengchongensis TaxID=2055889 RepID=UPI0036480139